MADTAEACRPGSQVLGDLEAYEQSQLIREGLVRCQLLGKRET